MQAGDTLIVSEVSCMVRVTLNLEVTVHVVKQDMVFAETPEMTTAIMVTVLGLAAQIECEFVSQRAKEALACSGLLRNSPFRTR